MEKVRYMISDAADMVHVETHVLRYWEEELDLTIPRNEMGHRYYTRENIKEFQRIKDLKDQGYQLKAIRMILHNGKFEELNSKEVLQSETQIRSQTDMQESVVKPLSSLQEQLPALRQTVAVENISTLSPEERMCQFRELMSDIVGQAIAQNNEELSQTIGKDVQELVLKEMNYLMREQDEAQEERYRKLDAAIRGTLKKRSMFGKEKGKPVNQ